MRQHELDYKHEMMAADTFSFLRATFYRWAELAPQALPDVADGVRVLAVGDLHVENYGTWRDVDGRLCWGVYDFDEVDELPYTNDLVRLATSAILAIEARHFALSVSEACEAILEGYAASRENGGRPVVLAERRRWLRRLALSDLRDPVAFWQRFDSLPSTASGVPPRCTPMTPR